MALSPTNQRQGGRDLAADVWFNEGKATDGAGTKSNAKDQLPPDMQSDLRDSFEYFAHGNDLINRSDFESIIHNFGFSRISQREKDNELKKNDEQYHSRTGFSLDFLEKVVHFRFYKQHGDNKEAEDAFNVFDRFERGQLKPSDLKQAFAEYLDHPVTDQDIQDIMASCDKSNLGHISFPEFKKFYFSLDKN